MKLIRVNDLVLCLEDETKPPKQSKHYFTIGGKQAADFLMECFNKNATAPAAQGDAKDEVYEFAAKVIELFDDATMRANHMLDAGECASIIRALKSTAIAAIAAKAAS